MLIRLLVFDINCGMGAIVAFFAKLNEKSTPKRTKEQHVINIANLNYCGIMKSPF